MIQLTIAGAAGGEVTGSCYILETGKARVMIDCGLFQGGADTDELNVNPLGTKKKLDAVLITHAHLDHVGRLPLLKKSGFNGPIHATPATAELAALILRDSARIEASDTERLNIRRMRAGESLVQPRYTTGEAEAVIRQFQNAPYQEPVEIAPGIQATWAEAGHMLGSGSILLTVRDGKTQKKIVFSGDLGPRNTPINRNFEPFKAADLVFLESTYGTRDHRPIKETVDEFRTVVKKAVAQKGKILIPTFAVGRAQLLTLMLSQMFRTENVPSFPIFLDSPMAIEATRIYGRHPELYDDELLAYIKERPMAADLKTLRATESADESRAINAMEGPLLVMAGAGMCTGGRILHHFKANLWKSQTHVLFVGYQSAGTLGRRLVDGAKDIHLFGEKIAVKAQIHTIGGLSAHAGGTDLLAWFEAINPAPKQVFLTHGEDRARKALAQALFKKHKIRAELPALNQTISLS
ncbi:MAG: MBL fold metallo-hydrolase [Verrucomicrobiales bacterium]